MRTINTEQVENESKYIYTRMKEDTNWRKLFLKGDIAKAKTKREISSEYECIKNLKAGKVAQLVEHRTCMPEASGSKYWLIVLWFYFIQNEINLKKRSSRNRLSFSWFSYLIEKQV